MSVTMGGTALAGGAETAMDKADVCSNCHVPLQGSYCHRCGQASRHFIRFFPLVVRELTEDTLGLDGRFWRTLVALLFRPGRLTIDYLSGRRVHYSPPIRLYLATSLMAFLIISLEVDSAIDASMHNNNDSVSVSVDGDRATSESDEGAATAPNVSASAGLKDGVTVQSRVPGADEEDDDFNLKFGAKAWDEKNNPLLIPFLPDRANERLNQEIAEFVDRIPDIKKDPRVLVDPVLEVLPQVMFLLLPAFALLLKVFYLFARRYYMEHLLFALHNHAFLFMLITLLAVIDTAVEWLSGSAVAVSVAESLALAGQLWMFIYLFLAQKRVYGQGVIFTGMKYLLVGCSYTILLSCVIVLAALVGAVLV